MPIIENSDLANLENEKEAAASALRQNVNTQLHRKNSAINEFVFSAWFMTTAGVYLFGAIPALAPIWGFVSLIFAKNGIQDVMQMREDREVARKLQNDFLEAEERLEEQQLIQQFDELARLDVQQSSPTHSPARLEY